MGMSAPRELLLEALSDAALTPAAEVSVALEGAALAQALKGSATLPALSDRCGLPAHGGARPIGGGVIGVELVYERRAQPMPRWAWLHPLYPDMRAPTGVTYPAWDVPAAPTGTSFRSPY